MKHTKLVNTNYRVIEIVCNKLQIESIIREDTEVRKEPMQLCTMKIFSKLMNHQLEAFTLAHDTSITSKNQLPAKGNLKDAEDNTVRNRIRIACECRMTTIKIKDALQFDLSNEQCINETKNYNDMPARVQYEPVHPVLCISKAGGSIPVLQFQQRSVCKK
jgi:hypothetical protein